MTGYVTIGLDEAEDLGGGFVMQMAREGNGCAFVRDPIIMDCNTGDAVIVGSELFDIMDEDQMPSAVDQVLDQVRASAKRGKPMKVDEIFSLAETRKTIGLSRTEVGALISVGGSMVVNNVDHGTKNFALGCACKTFYPDLGN